jgi:undecaprenyl-diphosphatase
MPDVDTSLFLWINATSASPSWLVPLARFASIELPQWMVAGTAGAFIVGDTRVRSAVFRILGAMAMAWLIARIGQYCFPMPRPFVLGVGTQWMAHGDSPGFPSTHASVAFGYAGAMIALARRVRVTAAALLLAAMVAWSRVCLGLHFPVDVTMGAVVGAFAGWLSGIVPAMVLRTRVAHD